MFQALRSQRIQVCLAVALAACGSEPSAPDAGVDNVAFAPGKGAVHGYVDASAVTAVALPDAAVRLKRISDSSVTATVTTAVNGSYIVPNVPAGTYVVCLNGTPGFTNACTSTQFVVTAGRVNYPPRAAFTPQRMVVYGRARLSDQTDIHYESPLYNKFVDTYVKATTTAGVTVSGPVRANHLGQYVLRTVPANTTVKIVATSETTTVQSTVAIATAPVNVNFTLPNRQPVVAETQVLQNGVTVRHVPTGAVVHAKVLASDPDGNALHYSWKAPGGSCPATDAAEVDCTVSATQGIQTIYVQVSDGKGQYELGRVQLSVGPPIALFSGKTITNGSVVVPNAEVVVNGLSTTTNATGAFSITVPETHRYVFTIKKDGYQTISKIYLHEKVGKTYKLLPAKADVLDPTKDNTIVVRVPQGTDASYGDATVTIKANSIVDSNGVKVTTPVTSYSSRFDHLFDKFGRMPGDSGAKNATGADVSLVSLGAIEVNLRGPGGAKYNIAPGMPADLTYPVHPSQTAQATPTMKLWYYNEQSGLWEEDGVATLSGGVYSAKAKHFSAINVDYEKVVATCQKMVVDETRLTPSFGVRITVPGYPTKDDTVDEVAEAIVRLPVGVAGATIVVLDNNGQPIPNSLRTFTTGTAIPAGTNTQLKAPYNECIAAAPAITLSVDLPQDPSIPFLARVSNDETYANSYYDTIDADPTLQAWKDRNDFQNSDDASAFYFNAGDLELGRSMHMNKRNDGGMAYYVTNFKNADKALAGATADVIATVAMEYSSYPKPSGSPKFTKFYVYDHDGNLINRVELDKRGEKFVPGLCIVCHGGSITDLVADGGDLGSRFIPFDLHSFTINPNEQGFPGGKPRAAQEEDFRKLNEALYFFTNASDAQKALIDGWYPGGVTVPGALQQDGIDNIPILWRNNATNKNFYNDVVRPSCRACHTSRDYGLDFADAAAFTGAGPFSAVCQSGYMPQSFVTWRNLWHSTNPVQPTKIETYLGQPPGSCTGP